MSKIISTVLALATLATFKSTAIDIQSDFECPPQQQCAVIAAQVTSILSSTTATNTSLITRLFTPQYIPFQNEYVDRLYLISSISADLDITQVICKPSWLFSDGTGEAGVAFGVDNSSSPLSVERSKVVTGVEVICNHV